MDANAWRAVLAASLVVNAALGFGYRVYRRKRGGPLGDVVGQAVLAAVLVTCALAVMFGASWARWTALAYAVLFGVVVMPLWTLAVLLPLPPGRPDYAFAASYWAILVLIGVAATAT